MYGPSTSLCCFANDKASFVALSIASCTSFFHPSAICLRASSSVLADERSIDVFAPDMGFDEDGEVYDAGMRGENTIAKPFEFDYLAGKGTGVSYGLAPKAGSAYVPLFTSMVRPTIDASAL